MIKRIKNNLGATLTLTERPERTAIEQLTMGARGETVRERRFRRPRACTAERAVHPRLRLAAAAFDSISSLIFSSFFFSANTPCTFS